MNFVKLYRFSCIFSTNMTDLYSVKDYRQFLRARLNEKKWGSITRFAEAIACQRSHVSRVLSGENELTPEQALAACRFWSLPDAESDFFCWLVDLSRAGTPELRRKLEGKLAQARREREDLAHRLGHERLGVEEREVLYYSAWYWSALHIMTSIERYQTSQSMAEKLMIPKALVEFCLSQMSEMGMVKFERGRWKFASTSLHLPKSSPLIGMHHQNWRSRAVMDTQSRSSDGVHYTVVQSLSLDDFNKLKAEVLRLIESYNRIAEPSEPEELVSLCCDFFRL